MRRYFFRRFLLLFPTIFLVSFFVFSIVRFIPGDIIALMASEQGYGFDGEGMRRVLGLDQPILSQYKDYMYKILRYGDFGDSLWSGEAITKELSDRIPVSAQLGLMALFFTVFTGVPIGVISALKQDTALDYIIRSSAIGGLSVPGFWVAILFLTFSALWFQWVPPMDYVSFIDSPLGSFRQLITPAFLMSISMSAGIMRMTRAMTKAIAGLLL